MSGIPDDVQVPELSDRIKAALANLQEAASGDLTDIVRGRHLAFARRRLRITIENGDNHSTFTFKPWMRNKPRNAGLSWLPSQFFIDVDTGGSAGVAFVRWPEGASPAVPGDPTFEWAPPRSWDRVWPSRALVYAGHLCFLVLSGTDITQVPFTDAKGIARPASPQYLIRKVTNCLRCGLELTQPSSIDQGYGEDCAAHIRAEYIRTRTRVLR